MLMNIQIEILFYLIYDQIAVDLCISNLPLTGAQLAPETFPTGQTVVGENALLQRQGRGRYQSRASQILCARCILGI